MSSKLKVLVDVPRDTISGIMDAVAPQNLGVVIDKTAPTKLAKATGQRGVYLLDREVVTAIGLEQHVFNNVIESPVQVGHEVSARRVRRIEVEGGDYLVISGEGAINGATAEDTELEYANGKLRVKGSGEVAGVLRFHMDPEDEDNATRIHVEMVD